MVLKANLRDFQLIIILKQKYMFLKNLILSVVVVLCSCSNIKGKATSTTLVSAVEVVNCYIEAITKGKPKMLKKILNENFQFRYGNERKTASKRELINFITKEIQDCIWDCDTSFEIIEQTSNLCIAKVNFKFRNEVRSDYITLCRSKSEWQIYNSVSTL